MAGPIGMAVLAATKTVVCPHCGARQVRDRHAAKVACKKCKRVFVARAAAPAPRRKRR